MSSTTFWCFVQWNDTHKAGTCSAEVTHTDSSSCKVICNNTLSPLLLSLSPVMVASKMFLAQMISSLLNTPSSARLTLPSSSRDTLVFSDWAFYWRGHFSFSFTTAIIDEVVLELLMLCSLFVLVAPLLCKLDLLRWSCFGLVTEFNTARGFPCLVLGFTKLSGSTFFLLIF